MKKAFQKLAGRTPERLGKKLLRAASKGDAKQVEKLIVAGASLDAKDSVGWTALHFAISLRDQKHTVEISKKLIDAGAGYDIKNMRGRTALDFVQGFGSSAIKQLLDTEIARRKKLAEDNPQPSAQDLTQMRKIFEKHLKR